MDISKISKGGLVFIGASLLFFISSFLTWFSFDFGVSGFDIAGADANGWDVGFLWCGLWVIVFLGLAVTLALPAFGQSGPQIPVVVYLGVGALGALLVLLKLLIGETGWDRSVGLFIATIAAIGVAGGGFLKFQESGGNLNDLKDMNKMKSQFGGAGGSTPPPPPGMTPPPPPPPPPSGGSNPPPPPPRMG